MNRIKNLREKLNIDQAHLSRKISVSQPTISDWETGRKKPSTKSAIKLAEFFNVSVDYILGREPLPQNTATIELTAIDQKLLAAYHAADPDIRFAVDLILKKHSK